MLFCLCSEYFLAYFFVMRLDIYIDIMHGSLSILCHNLKSAQNSNFLFSSLSLSLTHAQRHTYIQVILIVPFALLTCRKKLTRLSVNANGSLIPKDSIDRNLIKKSLW